MTRDLRRMNAIARFTRARPGFQLLTLVASAYLCLAGCGGGDGSGMTMSAPPPTAPPAGSPPPTTPPVMTPPPVTPPPMATVQGVLTGAHKAIQGASIILYRVGVHGYGSAATALGMTTTDATGAWTISFTKPADDPLVYIIANGGDVGSGPNAAIGLMAAIGPLSQVPNGLTVNEATTVASTYALAQFLDRATATNIGSAVANTVGLPNAFGNVANLVNVTSGVAFTSADAVTPIVNPLTKASEAPPGRVINSLAELMATCIGSSGSTSMNCLTFFGLATSQAGSAPTNTRQAILNIALNPGNRVAALYNQSRAAAAMFTPDLGTAVPNDWTLAISFMGGALAGPTFQAGPAGVAIDAEGDAWITNQVCNSSLSLIGGAGCVVELHPQGSQAGPFPQGIGLDFSHDGGAIAIGTNPNNGQEIVWVVSEFGSTLHALDTRDGSLLLGGALTSGLKAPQSVAMDLLGNVWVANSAPRTLTDGSTLASLIEFSPGSMNDYSEITEFDLATPAGGTPPSFAAMALDGDEPASIFVADQAASRIVEFSSATPGVQSNLPTFMLPATSYPAALAVDASGNVWAADESGGSPPGGASELLKGIGVPGFVERDFGGNTINLPGHPGGIAMDGAGNAWVANRDAAGNQGVVELTPNGVSISGLTALGAYNGASTSIDGPFGSSNVGTNPLGIAIDSSGNVWVATGAAGGVVELVGAATPVRTPLNTRAALP